jgi:hypothetical protein
MAEALARKNTFGIGMRDGITAAPNAKSLLPAIEDSACYPPAIWCIYWAWNTDYLAV